MHLGGFQVCFVDKESRRRRNGDVVACVEIRFELRNLNSVDLELDAAGGKYTPFPTYFV